MEQEVTTKFRKYPHDFISTAFSNFICAYGEIIVPSEVRIQAEHNNMLASYVPVGQHLLLRQQPVQVPPQCPK